MRVVRILTVLVFGVLVFFVVKLSLQNRAYRHNKPDPYLFSPVAYVNSTYVATDPLDAIESKRILREGVWEPHVTKLINSLVKKGDKVLSLGCNIGYHAANYAKLIGESGHLYCFEPNPRTLPFLYATLHLNKTENYAVFEKAAMNKAGSLKFLTPSFTSKLDGNVGISQVLYNEEARPEGDFTEITVEGVKIDDVMPEASGINLIQADIEESEYYAFLGAQKLIDNSPNLNLIVEWHAETMKKKNIPTEDYIKFWEDRGFKFGLIELDKITDLSKDDLLGRVAGDVIISKNLEEIKNIYK